MPDLNEHTDAPRVDSPESVAQRSERADVGHMAELQRLVSPQDFGKAGETIIDELEGKAEGDRTAFVSLLMQLLVRLLALSGRAGAASGEHASDAPTDSSAGYIDDLNIDERDAYESFLEAQAKPVLNGDPRPTFEGHLREKEAALVDVLRAIDGWNIDAERGLVELSNRRDELQREIKALKSMRHKRERQRDALNRMLSRALLEGNGRSMFEQDVGNRSIVRLPELAVLPSMRIGFPDPLPVGSLLFDRPNISGDEQMMRLGERTFLRLKRDGTNGWFVVGQVGNGA